MRKYSTQKKLKTAMLGMEAFICMAAYISGMTGYGRVSDTLLLIDLSLIVLGDIFFAVLRSEDKEIMEMRQFIIVRLFFAVLGISFLVYHKEAAWNNHVSVAVAVLACLWFICGVVEFVHFQKDFGGYIKKKIKENKDGLVVCGIFLFFSFSEIISISQWDGTFYINSLNNFVAEYDLTFKTLLNANMGGHLSTGYSLVAGIFHMLLSQGNIGVKICNILLGWGAILCFYKMLEKMEVNRFFCFAGTLMFAVSPMFLGTIGFISVDYAMMVYFIFFLYSWLYEKKIFMVVTGFLFLFTKETAIIIYFFFWLGIFLYRAFFGKQQGKVRWKKLFENLHKGEWEAILIPTGLFLLTFGVYAYEKIGWPGLVAGNIKISMKLIAAVILLAAVFLTALKIWINLWHFVGNSRISEKRKKAGLAGVLLLPFLLALAGVLAVWVIKPDIIRHFVVYSAKDINRIGIGKAHIAAILKQAYILNFSWILLIITVIGLVYFIKEWSSRKTEKRELVISAIFADMGLIAFTMAYVTYQNPRYLQLHYAFMIFLMVVLWSDIWKDRGRKQRFAGNAAAGILVVLLFCESYVYIDPLTRMSFYNRDIGNGVLCAGDTKKISGVSSSYSDRAVNNRVYTYYLKSFEKFLKDINYDGSQYLLFPNKNNWTTLGRKDISTMDTELKCMISYEGSIADSVVHVENVEQLEAYLTSDVDVYYVDTGALHTKMDKTMEETYSDMVYKTYTTGAWRITVYKLE